MSTEPNPFTSEDHEVIAATARRMKVFGYLLIISVILSAGAVVIQMLMFAQGPATTLIGAIIGALIPAIISGIIAWLTIQAAAAMETAAQDPGSSTQPLSNTIRELKRLYGFQYALIVILISVVVIGMIVAVLLAMFA